MRIDASLLFRKSQVYYVTLLKIIINLNKQRNGMFHTGGWSGRAD